MSEQIKDSDFKPFDMSVSKFKPKRWQGDWSASFNSVALIIAAKVVGMFFMCTFVFEIIK